MRSFLALMTLSCSLVSAAPVTWYLSQVTLSDGGRAVGSFVYDASTRSFSNINVQTTPGSATTSAASSIAGGNYTARIPAPDPPPTTPPAVIFISGPIGGSATRILNLLSPNTLTDAGGIVQLTAGSVEGFCNATCTSVLPTSPSRSVLNGSLVAGSSAGTTWYVTGTFDDGGQMIGQFDIDAAAGAYTNIDIATTAGTNQTTPARIRFARPGVFSSVAVLQSDPVAQAGTRTLILSLGAVTPGATVVPFQPGNSIEGTCPAPSSPSCPLESTNFRRLVAGSATSVRPPNYVKVISQIADGDGWQTTLILTNLTDGPATYALNFTQDDGSPFNIPAIGPFVSATVPARGVTFLTSTNPRSLSTGWGRLIGGNNFGVSTIFVWKNANAGGDQQGSVAGDAQGETSLAVPFDNTGGAVSGLALVNTSASPITVLSVGYDETGRILMTDSSLTIPGLGHTSFVFGQRPGYSALANRRGLLRLFALHGGLPPYSGLNGLLLKFLPNGAFTTVGVTNQ